MVLEEATRSAEAVPSDTPPSDDVDRYAERSSPAYASTREPSFASVARDGAQGRVFVNLANLPKPFSPFGERPHPPIIVESIQDSCRFAQQVLQRPPTQEEADAFAYHAAKTYRVASFGSPLGMSLASLQFFRTRSTFRFPGWSPFKESSNLSNWNKDKLGPLTGTTARMGWHSLRLMSYWLLGSVVGAVFLGSYAVSLSLAGRAMDPRLKEFTEKLKQLQQDGVSIQSIRRQQDVEGTTQEETFEQRRQRRAVQGMSRESQHSSSEQSRTSGQSNVQSREWDDASPTGGAFDNDYSDPLSDTGVLSDDKPQYGQQDDAWSKPAAQRASTESRATPQRSTEYAQGANQGDAATQQTGSAWDRLRQQAAAGGNASSGAQKSRAQQEESSGNDSW
ncbi:hypothetical protein Q7P37_007091 [Cladosporium fusiforme]